jgi:hypothetical protein
MKLCTLFLFALALYPAGDAGHRPIDKLDQLIQGRFGSHTFTAKQRGMSRVVAPSSIGRHFEAAEGAVIDFYPESDAERALIQELQKEGLRVGLYAFGAAITHTDAKTMDFRALKGPGIATPGTIRPAWNPPFPAKPSPPEALPDWNTVYPIARSAMLRFEKGDTSMDSDASGWTISARSVRASSENCLACHNSAAIGRAGYPIRLNDAVGGVLYVYRYAK